MIYRVSSGETIHVGVGTLLSGIEASVGREVLSGADAFLKDHPTLLGHPLALVPLDDGCDPMLTLEKARIFCSMKPRPVAVVGYLCTPGSLEALAIHAACKLPLLNVSSSDPRLTQTGSPWLVRLWTSRDMQAFLVAKWIRTRRINRVMVIQEMDSKSTTMADVFQDAIQKFSPRSKVKIIAQDEVRGNASAFFQEKAAPQLVYYVGSEIRLVDLWKQLPEQALARAWIQGHRLENWLTSDLQVPIPKELYCIALQLPTGDPLSPQYQYFRGRFGEPGVYTLAAYDALSVLVNALRKTAIAVHEGTEWDMTKLMSTLRETEIHGLTGPISFDERGNRTQASGRMLRWKDGQWESQWTGKLP